MKKIAMYIYESDNYGSPGLRAEPPGTRAKFFGYPKFGKVEALARAKAYVEKFIDPSRINPQTGRRVNKNDKGVFRVVRMVAQRNGTKLRSVRWVAQWQEKPGQNKRKEFSVKKYGAAGAREKAEAHRAAMVAKVLA